jgi:hypothetical protein
MAKPMQAPLFSPAQISVGEETLPPGLLMNAISQVPNIAAALAMNPAPYPQAFPGTMPAAGRASSFLPRPSIPVTVYPTITVRL